MPSKEELEDVIEKYSNSPCTYQTCQSLALFLYLKDKLYGEDRAYSDKDFRYDIGPEKFWEIFDELLEALQVLNPKLYQSVIQKLEG